MGSEGLPYACRGVPVSPGARIVRERLAGDISQRLEHPTTGLGVQGVVFREVEQPRHGRPTLAVTQHPGLGEPASRALPNQRRRIVVKDPKQRLDRFIRRQIGEAFDRPRGEKGLR